MGNQNEDYLDQLLNALGSQEAPEDELLGLTVEKKSEKPLKETNKSRKRGSSFLDDYEEELQGLDADNIISDFETMLEEDLGNGPLFSRSLAFSKDSVSDEEVNEVAETVIIESAIPKEDYSTQGPKKVVEDVEYDPILDQAASGELDESFFTGLEKAMHGEEPQEEEASLVDELSEESDETFAAAEEDEPEISEIEDIQEIPETIDESVAEETVETPEEEVPATPMSMSDEDIFSAFLSGDAGGNTGGGAGLEEFGFGNLFGEPDTSASSEPASNADILEMLGASGDEELADIGKMLKAQDNKEDLSNEELGVSEEDALGMIRDLDADQAKAAEKKGRKGRGKKAGDKKGGFLAKIAALFEDEDEEQAIHIHPNKEIEDTTAENQGILASMTGKGNTDPEKQAKKEQQKKAREAKKEAKKAAQEEKKRLKAAEKKAKPKKEKKPKEIDNSPPLPKKPVMLIFLLAASIVGAVLFASNGLHYTLCMKHARDAYAAGNYVEAYEQIRNTEIKDGDRQFAETIGILACMQELVESHDTLYEAEEYEMALDCLVRVVGRFEDNYEKAVELDIMTQMSAIETKAENLLESQYALTYEETLEIYHIRTRMKYSMRLVEQLREVGLIR